jgi:hypothetical protein
MLELANARLRHMHNQDLEQENRITGSELHQPVLLSIQHIQKILLRMKKLFRKFDKKARTTPGRLT